MKTETCRSQRNCTRPVYACRIPTARVRLPLVLVRRCMWKKKLFVFKFREKSKTVCYLMCSFFISLIFSFIFSPGRSAFFTRLIRVFTGTKSNSSKTIFRNTHWFIFPGKKRKLSFFSNIRRDFQCLDENRSTLSVTYSAMSTKISTTRYKTLLFRNFIRLFVLPVVLRSSRTRVSIQLRWTFLHRFIRSIKLIHLLITG